MSKYLNHSQNPSLKGGPVMAMGKQEGQRAASKHAIVDNEPNWGSTPPVSCCSRTLQAVLQGGTPKSTVKLAAAQAAPWHRPANYYPQLDSATDREYPVRGHTRGTHREQTDYGKLESSPQKEEI